MEDSINEAGRVGDQCIGPFEEARADRIEIPDLNGIEKVGEVWRPLGISLSSIPSLVKGPY